MSLINEALKKARATQPASPTAATAAGPALQPAEAGARARNGSLFTLPFFIALALMLAVMLLWAWYRSGRVELVVRADTSATTAVNAAASTVAPTPITAPATASPRMAAIPLVAARADTISTNAVETWETSKPPKPAYRLEGIFFRSNRPSAVINGQIVYVGSRLEAARVTAIDKDSATIITSAGQTNVLVPVN